MHVYAFGSICRGDVGPGSDIDLLALVNGFDSRFDPDVFSVYSYERIREIWNEGNPFAWHLAWESKLIFSSDQEDYVRALGNPGRYRRCVADCTRFFALFREARQSIERHSPSRVFDLSTVFLSIRNIATCFSLGATEHPDFSRGSARNLGDMSIPLPIDAYKVFERARILCTRARGPDITAEEFDFAVRHLGLIEDWMHNLVQGAVQHERIQQSH